MFFVALTKGDAMRLRELLASYDLDVPMVEEPCWLCFPGVNLGVPS